MEKIFVDTDIIIDLLGNRIPFHEHSASLFSLADRNKVRIYVSALSFANLHYILSRQFTVEQSRRNLLKLKTLVRVLPVTDKVLDLALASDFKDFEDGIQYFTATEQNIKVFLTRNIKDYKKAGIPVMTAEQYLKTWK